VQVSQAGDAWRYDRVSSAPDRPEKAMWWFHGDAKVNGKVVAEADVGAMLTD
jgi:3-hydroxymyristoyl/3-hydroxydecanoyl-(acyl carrier protein) dehydratase